MRSLVIAIFCITCLASLPLAASAASRPSTRPTTRPATRPAQSEELKLLGMYRGTWEVKTTLEGPPPEIKTYTVKVIWTVDNQYLRHRRILPDRGTVALEMMTYDPSDGNYYCWTFEPRVRPVLLNGRWDEKNRRFIWTGRTSKVFYKIVDHFIADGTIESKVTMSDSSDREIGSWESKATRINKK